MLIIALLVATFSVIGLNLDAIKYLNANGLTSNLKNYIGTILAINISLVFAMYSIFYFLNMCITREDGLKFGIKKDFIYLLLLTFMIIICLILIA